MNRFNPRSPGRVPRKKSGCPLLIAAMLFFCLGPDSIGSDWPRFLGPHGTGVSDETGLLERWPESGPPVVWNIPLGTGYSAPSVRGNRVVVHHRIKNEEIVECLDTATGKSQWKYAYPSRYQDPYGYNNGPRCTPLLTESRCFTY